MAEPAEARAGMPRQGHTIIRTAADFGAGPLAVTADCDPQGLACDDRLVVIFGECEMLFTVIGRVRNALHLGGYLAPWCFIHWRLEHKGGAWLLSTTERVEIDRLRRFYGARSGM